MAPLTLEISSSIIFPRTNSLGDGSITIDLSAPTQVGGGRAPFKPPTPPTKAVLLTGPEHPLYRLPQSISSGGLKIHLNTYVPPKASERPYRRSMLSTIDAEHIIYEITKASVGDAGAQYALSNFHRDDGEGGYGKGSAKFTPGWLSGGIWTFTYVYKMEGQVQESRVDLKVDEGGKQDGVWKMTFPMEGTVAVEKPQEEGAFGENGRTLEIAEGSPGLDGWTEDEWRDFVTACWVAKVWNVCTRTKWFGVSIRSGEARGLTNW